MLHLPLIIDTSDPRPIGRQIEEGLLQLVTSGTLAPGEPIPSVRDLIDFRQVNLCHSLGGLGSFDLICCRNVLIYFDALTRQRICQQFHALLREQGWLLLGTAENLYGIATNFASVRVGDALFYRKVSSVNVSGGG